MQKETSKKIEEIKDDISHNLRNIFKNYKITLVGEKIFITGVLILLIDNKVIDRYLIKIEMPDFKNNYYPIVREVGGKIPHSSGSRHVNTNGTACLFYPDDFKKYYTEYTKLSEFIKKTVFHYYVAQTYYEIENKWIFGELGHNDVGAYEFYSEKFNMKDLSIIVSFLEFIVENKHIKKGDNCPCGSLKKFRNCHFKILMQIKKDVPKSMLERSLWRIERLHKNWKKRLKGEQVILAAIRKNKPSLFSTKNYLLKEEFNNSQVRNSFQ